MFNEEYEDDYEEQFRTEEKAAERPYLTESETKELQQAVAAGMKRGWDWMELRRHPNPHVRRAAKSNLSGGRQQVTSKRSVGIGTSNNYWGGGQTSVGIVRGQAVAGTGVPDGAAH